MFGRKNKRLTAAMLSAAMLFGNAGSVIPGSAVQPETVTVTEEYAGRNEDAASPQFVLGSVSAEQGDEVKVDLEIKNNPGIVSYRLLVSYNTSVLTLTDAELYPMSDLTEYNNEDVQYNVPYTGPLDTSPFCVSWADALHPNNTYNGKIVTLTFKIAKTAEPGTYNLGLAFDPEEIFNKSFKDVEFTGADGSVKVSKKCYHTAAVATAAKAATCTAAGNTAYWYCSECGKYFSDSAYTTEITQASTVIAATGHSLSATAAKAATCTEAGNKAYWYCSKCKKYFSDSNASAEITQAATVIAATGHSLTAAAAKKVSCTEDGNIAYWYCSKCKKYFSDKNASTEIAQADTVIKSTGHHYTDKVIAPTRTAQGYTEHTCSACGDSYRDNYTDPIPGGVPKISISVKSAGKLDADKPVEVIVTDAEGKVCETELDTDGTYKVMDIADGQYTVTVKQYGHAPETVIVNSDGVLCEIGCTLYHYGDCDSNGTVNLKDLVMFRRYLNKYPDININLNAANMNGDKKINLKDFTILQRYLNKWPISFDF